jgi:hypothetical protein
MAPIDRGADVNSKNKMATHLCTVCKGTKSRWPLLMMNGADRIDTNDPLPARRVYEEALAAVEAESSKSFNSFKNPWATMMMRHEADGRWQMAGGRMADGRWQMADGRWQMAGGRWQVAGAVIIWHSTRPSYNSNNKD